MPLFYSEHSLDTLFNKKQHPFGGLRDIIYIFHFNTSPLVAGSSFAQSFKPSTLIPNGFDAILSLSERIRLAAISAEYVITSRQKRACSL
jgi:hypothetical protein